MENVDAVAGEASSAYSAASTESWTFSANATSAEALREEHELAQEYMAKEHAMALAAEVAVMVANSHCDAENDQEHHAAIEAVTAALADGPSADDRRQQMNELVEARAKKFIKLAKENDFEIVYLQNNPKVKGDAKKKFSEGKTSWKLYERFKKGTTIKGAIELGATMDRINDDYEHGYIRFPGRESREPGHVFLADGEKASDLVSLLGIDYDMGLSNTGEFEYALKGAEEAAKKAEEKLRKNFNEVIATCYDAEEDCRRILDGRGERECCKGEAPNASFSRTSSSQGTRGARLRVQVLVSNRKFIIHLWMYAARHRGRDGNPSEARSHAGKKHVDVAKRLIQYVYNTRTLGIKYSRESDGEKNTPIIYGQGRHPLDDGKNHMMVFADSDYAADYSRRSTQGCVVMMNGGPIAWSAVLGKTICCSTAEAEVMAAVSASKEALHLKLLLKEIGVKHGILTIHEDNQACIAQVTGGLRHIRKAKHYSIALRFLQKLVLDKDVEFEYCDTNSQIADLFTKALDEQKFNYFASKIMYDSGSDPDYTMMCLYDEDTGNWSNAKMLSEQDKLMEEHFSEDA